MALKQGRSGLNKYSLLFWGFAALTLGVGIYHSSTLRFVTDDAFISFRYAKNLVSGYGLVFNPGEKVEGYTNFLWTVLLGSGFKFSLDPVILSEVLGIFFYACTLLLCCFASRRMQRSSNTAFI